MLQIKCFKGIQKQLLLIITYTNVNTKKRSVQGSFISVYDNNTKKMQLI